jgi:hypothetical protein
VRKVYQTLAAMAVLACASCAPQPALAWEIPPVDTAGVHLGSVHSNNYDAVSQKPWNNLNPGIYFRADNIVFGTYFNSVRKQSVYLGYSYAVTDNIDVVVGIVSGYNGPGYSAKAVMPMVVPSIHFPISGGVVGRISIAPQVAKGGATAVHFSLEWKL